MAYVIDCLDRVNAQAVRRANRQAHLNWLREQYGDKVIAAGPLLSEDGETMIGSLLIMDFTRRTEAETFCAGDPYAKAGLFEAVSIRPWKKVLPV